MKIEKISENQIKCTLTRSDLASRQLKLNELTYGTAKAKGLFQDMMEQANLEFGFDASEMPLMIEAIPVSMDCVILMITKVENPDEVDTRFSTLSNLKEILGEADAPDDCCSEGCTVSHNSMDSLAEFSDLTKKVLQKVPDIAQRMFSFDSLETVIDYAHNVKGLAIGPNTLYKSTDNGRYYLFLQRKPEKPADFAQICGSAMEFGHIEQFGSARTAYMDEHYDTILRANALQSLAEI